MQTQKVRLLNSSIYDTSKLKGAPYPLVVDALVDSPMQGMAMVINGVDDTGAINIHDDIDVLKYLLSNTIFYNKKECNSWQVVSNNPFDYWNRLKNSRDAGEMPKADTYL